MKKILLVANVAKEHVLKFHVPTIKMLKDLGWRVDVACGGNEKIPYCDTQYFLSYQRATVNFNTFKGFKEVIDIVRHEQYDIIYCHTAVGGVAGRLAGILSRNKGTKVVFFDHGFDFCKGAPFINWLTFYPVERILAKVTDAIICINQEDYDITLKKLRPPKTFMIEGIGMNCNRFDVEEREEIKKRYREELGIPSDSVVLIYLAELIKNKNQKLLIDTLKLVRKKYENTYLVLAGFDHCHGEYQQYAEQIGEGQFVKYLGWREDVGNLYAMADICVASSILEGLGLNLVEAMYSGLPVVATKNRGHSTVIEDGENGFLVEQGNVEQFAEKVNSLIENENLRIKFIEAGYCTQEKYRDINVLKKIRNILENI